jgi:hypothetical protein
VPVVPTVNITLQADVCSLSKHANGLLRLALLSPFINIDYQVLKYKFTYNKFVQFSLILLKQVFVVSLHSNFESELLKVLNHLWIKPHADVQRSTLIRKILFASTDIIINFIIIIRKKTVVLTCKNSNISCNPNNSSFYKCLRYIRWEELIKNNKHKLRNERCSLLGFLAAYNRSLLPPFREKLSVPCLDLEDGTDILSRNVGKDHHPTKHKYPRRVQISFTPRRKPEITQNM